MEGETQEKQPVMGLPQGERQEMKLLYRRQYEGQLLWREQPMEEETQEKQPVMGLPQGERQMTELLLRRRQGMQLPQGEEALSLPLPLPFPLGHH